MVAREDEVTDFRKFNKIFIHKKFSRKKTSGK